MGPTASGKTDLALEMAQHWPFEVISVDSALIYRDMNIGTAKPDGEFLARLPHHLIDICDPHEVYSAVQFRRDAMALMDDIVRRGRIPLLVGGTMLYYKVLLEGVAELPVAEPAFRQQLLAEAERLGWPALHQRLAKVDPRTAAKLHPNHSQRIQRALEVYQATGQPLSELHAQQQQQTLPYQILQLALWPSDRAALHWRIAQRFEQMLAQGFVEELRQLRASYPLTLDMPSMRAVGYRQVWHYLEGDIDSDQLIAQGVAATRQLAKRQLTWLRKWSDLHKLETAFQKPAPFDTQKNPILSRIRSLLTTFEV